jgi:hypothetical protein
MSDFVTEAITDYQKLLKIREELNVTIDEAKQRIIDLAATKGQKSLSAHVGDTRIVATVTSRTTTKFNEEGLKKALGANSYKRLCKLTIDRAKLDKAIEKNEVDPVIVAQYTEIGQSAISIRLTEKPDE